MQNDYQKAMSFRAKRRRVVERSEKSRVHQVYVIQILPPFGRLDDKPFTKICGAKNKTT